MEEVWSTIHNTGLNNRQWLYWLPAQDHGNDEHHTWQL